MAGQRRTYPEMCGTPTFIQSQLDDHRRFKCNVDDELENTGDLVAFAKSLKRLFAKASTMREAPLAEAVQTFEEWLNKLRARQAEHPQLKDFEISLQELQASAPLAMHTATLTHMFASVSMTGTQSC